MRTPRIGDRRYRKFRRGVMLRDGGRCRYAYPGCTVVATQVDHLVPRIKKAPLMDESNCYSVCHSCHREKERRERAGEPIGFFKDGEVPEMRQSPYLSPRDLPISGDYSRKRRVSGDAAS